MFILSFLILSALVGEVPGGRCSAPTGAASPSGHPPSAAVPRQCSASRRQQPVAAAEAETALVSLRNRQGIRTLVPRAAAVQGCGHLFVLWSTHLLEIWNSSLNIFFEINSVILKNCALLTGYTARYQNVFLKYLTCRGYVGLWSGIRIKCHGWDKRSWVRSRIRDFKLSFRHFDSPIMCIRVGQCWNLEKRNI